MIARIWHGRTRTEEAEEYLEYVRKTGVAAQRLMSGNLSSMVLTRVDQAVTHFVVFSLWESWDAIRSFAGERAERAVYFPEDERYLLELEAEVEHYEVGVCETVALPYPVESDGRC